jgi:hypothetical protein
MAMERMMFKGLYKVEFQTPRRKAVGVIYADGSQLRGGSSAFVYFGSYTQEGTSVRGVIQSRRHTEDPNFPPVFGVDAVTIAFEGTSKNDMAICEGTADEKPSLKFKALLTRVSD